jgi:hypothetical protein
MAAKTTLNARNLEALGAKRLAELLIDLSTGDAAAKRRLRLELAGTNGTARSPARFSSGSPPSRSPAPTSTGRSGAHW